MIYVHRRRGQAGLHGAALALTILKERMHGKRVKAIKMKERESVRMGAAISVYTYI